MQQKRRRYPCFLFKDHAFEVPIFVDDDYLKENVGMVGVESIRCIC